MLLCTLTYSGRVDVQLIWILLAFATVPAFRDEPSPDKLSYTLSLGFSAEPDTTTKAVRSAAVSYEDSQESKTPAKTRRESEQELEDRRRKLYLTNLGSEVDSVVRRLCGQWPCSSPSFPLASECRLLSMSKVEGQVRPLFSEWYRNKLFREHIERV
jgi:hypothetical protein